MQPRLAKKVTRGLFLKRVGHQLKTFTRHTCIGCRELKIPGTSFASSPQRRWHQQDMIDGDPDVVGPSGSDVSENVNLFPLYNSFYQSAPTPLETFFVLTLLQLSSIITVDK